MARPCNRRQTPDGWASRHKAPSLTRWIHGVLRSLVLPSSQGRGRATVRARPGGREDDEDEEGDQQQVPWPNETTARLSRLLALAGSVVRVAATPPSSPVAGGQPI